MRRPPAWGSPSLGEAAGPLDSGRGLAGFSRDCPEEALVMRARGERPGMEDGCSHRGGVLMGSRCGCGPDPGSSRPGRTEWAQPPASGEENEGRRWPRSPGEEGCGERALWSGGPGKSSGVPTSGGWPAARDPASELCQAAWRERLRGAQSPHPRTHSPRACSVRPWELPAESRAARPPPRPGLTKLGVAGRASRGRGPRLSPIGVPVLVPCLAFARPQKLLSPAASTTENGGVDVIFLSPRPGPRPRGRRPGGAAACGVYLLAVHLPGARTPRGEQTGWKGVCERGDVGAHTRCHTQSRGFVATAP